MVNNTPANAGDPGSIPGLRRSPGEGDDNLLQCSYLGSPTDSGAWWATIRGVAKSQTQLSDNKESEGGQLPAGFLVSSMSGLTLFSPLGVSLDCCFC